MATRKSIHEVRAAASAHGLAARWGGRGKSKFVRVDPDVADLVKRLPERVRRSRVSAAIRADVAAYLRDEG